MNGQLIARRPLLDRQGLDLCEGTGGTSMSMKRVPDRSTKQVEEGWKLLPTGAAVFSRFLFK